MPNFYGHETGELTNGIVTLEYLKNAGPRIIRFGLKDDRNVLAEIPDFEMDDTDLKLLGGHRLWHAPEAHNRTDLPDDTPPTITEIENGVTIAQTPDASGFAKTISIELDPNAAIVHLNHRLTNHNIWPIETAVWSITQMALGGIASVPLQTEPLDKDGLQPNKSFVFWPYADLNDPRLAYTEMTISIAGQPGKPFKIGTLNRGGFMSYQLDDLLFLKNFRPSPDQKHTDLGCNTEIYVNDAFLELEALSPLLTLQPGQSLDFYERWALHKIKPS